MRAKQPAATPQGSPACCMQTHPLSCAAGHRPTCTAACRRMGTLRWARQIFSRKPPRCNSSRGLPCARTCQPLKEGNHLVQGRVLSACRDARVFALVPGFKRCLCQAADVGAAGQRQRLVAGAHDVGCGLERVDSQDAICEGGVCVSAREGRYEAGSVWRTATLCLAA